MTRKQYQPIGSTVHFLIGPGRLWPWQQYSSQVWLANCPTQTNVTSSVFNTQQEAEDSTVCQNQHTPHAQRHIITESGDFVPSDPLHSLVMSRENAWGKRRRPFFLLMHLFFSISTLKPWGRFWFSLHCCVIYGSNFDETLQESAWTEKVTLFFAAESPFCAWSRWRFPLEAPMHNGPLFSFLQPLDMGIATTYGSHGDNTWDLCCQARLPCDSHSALGAEHRQWSEHEYAVVELIT